jgi:hypothetical protein
MFDVSPQVNNTANDSPDCISPVEATQEGATEKEATTKHTKHTKNSRNTDDTEQFLLGELLAPVRPRSPG